MATWERAVSTVTGWCAVSLPLVVLIGRGAEICKRSCPSGLDGRRHSPGAGATAGADIAELAGDSSL